MLILLSKRTMETKTSILPKLKFKALTQQLTDNEFDKLLSKFRLQIGREQMLKLIWDGTSDSQLSALKGEILPIMQQRKSKDKADNPSTSVAGHRHTITTLPTTMIGEIASNLDQKAYARFATTNRKMFVDSNSPNRLVALDLDVVEDFKFISIANYRYLSSLEFAVVDIDDFDYSHMFRCRRLRTLMITGEQDGAVEKLSRFIDDMDGAFTGVTKLALYGFLRLRQENISTTLPPELLVQLLALFPALTDLKLLNPDFTDHLDDALLADCCPSLNRLATRGVQQETSFLNAYGEQLTTLTLSSDVDGFVPPDLDYSKLRRLCLFAPTQNAMNGFLKTSKNLKEICFGPLEIKGSTEVQPMGDAEIKRVTKKLIVDFKSLRFFHVSTRGHFENICDSIQKGLYCTRNQKREFMEIGLTVDCREITDFDDFMCSVSRIIAGLTQFETEKWMLSLDANQHRSFAMDQVSMAQAVSALMTSYKNLNVELLFAGEWDYMFGSKGVSILDAHRDWWNDCWKIDFY